MKMPQKLIAIFATLLIIMSFPFPAFTVNADKLVENTAQDYTCASDDAAAEEQQQATEAALTEAESLPLPDTDENLSQETTTMAEESGSSSDDILPAETAQEEEMELPLTDGGELPQESAAMIAEDAGIPVPDEAPQFTAHIEYSSQGYLVKGYFTDFTPDLCHIQPLYSLDGKNWQNGGVEWDLQWLGTEDKDKRKLLQNQICLYDSYEPLKSYLAGTLDRFCLKLQLTKESGITYESQTAVIDRGELQPIPEGIILTASFAPSMRVLERNPFRVYGKYQITINADSDADAVTAFLPDTLPIEVQIQPQNDISHTAICTIDCPVTWKPLSSPLPAAGESVTIPDAAEEIVIPCETLLKTPLGTFRLDEPLRVEQDAVLTDEVSLVLNAAPEDGNPTGVLTANKNVLEMSFHLKPTGATSIRAYTLSEGSSKWEEISEHLLLDAVNAQPSTANSGYASVLDSNQEPYRSYLEAVNAGKDPVPFFVGLKIEGGVYNGRQLILAWPNTYDPPLDLPEVGGSGGNQGNAGAGNKDDSTDEGQRPNLPQSQENEPDKADETQLPQNPQPLQNTALIPDVTDKSPLKLPPETQTAADIMTKEASTADITTRESSTAADITAKKASTAADSVIDTELDIPVDTMDTTVQPTAPAKIKAASDTHSSDGGEQADTLEKTVLNAENSSYNYLPLAAAAVIAGFYLVLFIRRTVRK